MKGLKQYIVVESAALNSTAVSRVISPASSAQVSGHASKITIPSYPCALPIGGIYTLATDWVWSETERSLPQSVASLVLNTNRAIVLQCGTNKFRAANFV